MNRDVQPGDITQRTFPTLSPDDAARLFDVEVMRAPVHNDDGISRPFSKDFQVKIALLVPSDAFTYFRSPTIVALAAKSELPAIYAFRRFAAGGGLAACRRRYSQPPTR